MKIDILKTAIGIAISAVIAYVYCSIAVDGSELLVALVSFVTLTTTSIVAIGCQSDGERPKIIIKSVSWVFFLVFVISNLVFSLVDFNDTLYISGSAILFLIYLLMFASLRRANFSQR